MQIIPAIDIKDRKVVRLAQGAAEDAVVYSGSPEGIAKKWDSFGVGLIHVVDLDGAFEGSPKNLDAVKKIAGAVKARVELGGGIRDAESIKKVLDAGIEKVVIGTRALEEKFLKDAVERFGGRIVVGMDVRGDLVYTKGWTEKSDTKIVDFIKLLEDAGVSTINYTDISRDGMLEGPNVEGIKNILKSTKMNVVASGGVSSMDDVKRLARLEKDGLKGIIIGKALYEGKVDLGKAMLICRVKGQGASKKIC